MAAVIGVAAACSDLRVAGQTDAGPVPPQTEEDASAVDAGGGAEGGADAACTTPAANDPDNCGVCGRSCGGGACQAGVCQPLLLATKRLSPADIAVRAGYVYWAEQGTATNAGKDGRVARSPIVCAQAGGCATDLADAGASLSGIAVNAEHVYVTQGTLSTGAVRRVAFAGGTLETFAPNEPGARRIALDSTSAFWVNAGSAPGDGRLRRRYLDDTFDAGTIRGSLDYPAAVTVYGGKVFYTVRGQLDFDGGVFRCEIDGSSPVPIAYGQAQPRGLAVDKTFVYWTNRGNGTIHRARWDGTDDVELVTSARSPNGIAVDGDGIYWTESGTDPDLLDGRVRSADLDGKNIVTLVDPAPALVGLAVEGMFVYAASRGTLDAGYRDGSILKVRKR